MGARPLHRRDTCSRDGTQTHLARLFACIGSSCVPRNMKQCARDTDNVPCASWSCEAWSACARFERASDERSCASKHPCARPEQRLRDTHPFNVAILGEVLGDHLGRDVTLEPVPRTRAPCTGERRRPAAFRARHDLAGSDARSDRVAHAIRSLAPPRGRCGPYAAPAPRGSRPGLAKHTTAS